MKLNKRYTVDEVRNKFKEDWNDLYEIASKYTSTKLLDPECSHYLKYYNNFFSEYQKTAKSMLEIGIKDGQSIKIWRDYFSLDTKVVGIEINKEPLEGFNLPNTEVYFGDQTDYDFLHNLIKKEKKFDIIIDDGGHTQEQLKSSFEYLFKYGLKSGGIYVMEDLGCSYWHRWSGGLNNRNNIINFLKDKIENINFRFWKGNRNDYIPKPSYSDIDTTFWDENIESLFFVKGMCFIKKGDNTFHKE